MIPLVTLRSTYEEVWWAEECPECGAETVAPTECERLDWPGIWRGEQLCPEHGAVFPTPANDPSELRGWCDPLSPWSDYSRDEDTPIELVTTALEAAEIVAAFPGGVWDYSEGESEQDYRTGHYVSVTLHIDDHMANTVFELADMALSA